MRNLLFILCLFTMACANNQTDEAQAVIPSDEEAMKTDNTDQNTAAKSEPLTFTTNLENLRLRDEPGTEGKELARLPIGTKVYDTGAVSDFTTPLKLRGVNFDEPWIKVKTAEGISGWIYGGGLNFPLEEDSPVAQALIQKRLAGMFGQKLASDLKIYRNNYNNANTSEAFAKVYEDGVDLRDRFVGLLEEKIEVNYDELPDLFWLRQVMPGYVPQLAAEGTIYYLFNDYKEFQKKALTTTGLEDDEMTELFFMVHEMDSVEHFFPAWFMQTWDYGGHSLLGRGIHNGILAKLGDYKSKTTLFSKTNIDLKNQIVKDIVEQHSAYWEPAATVKAELKKIIAEHNKILTKEDVVVLETRLKMMDDPKANKIEFNARAGI